MTVQYRSMSQ
uniref:Uncharacterized protein n=1 Tax=Arundo donax TaxID=35708 RepID=A0A0A9G2T4_ARUDO